MIISSLKKKIINIINFVSLNFFNYVFYPIIKYEKVINLIEKIKPKDLGYDLIRIGPNGDGGYLVPNILDQIDECFSPGVGLISGFEEYLCNKNIKVFMADNAVEKPNINSKNYDFIKKNIGSFNNEKFMTLDSWIDKKSQSDKNLLLQMDIEGHEYNSISSLTEKNLSKFNVLIIEFHFFEQIVTTSGYNKMTDVFLKLLKYFDVAHIHPNNCCGYYRIKDLLIPSTLEITFLNKALTKHKKKINQLPHPFDYKNVERNKDIFLNEKWY